MNFSKTLTAVEEKAIDIILPLTAFLDDLDDYADGDFCSSLPTPLIDENEGTVQVTWTGKGCSLSLYSSFGSVYAVMVSGTSAHTTKGPTVEYVVACLQTIMENK